MTARILSGKEYAAKIKEAAKKEAESLGIRPGLAVVMVGDNPASAVYVRNKNKACEELGVDCQLSLERHMKCGAGVCGCCVMDGQRVCKDGPVFTKTQIAQMKDFGVQKRDECGRVVKFRKG